MIRVIKKYTNRRLYDTCEKRTITLEELSDLIRRGVEVKVVDNKTGEDITAHTLSQILAVRSKECKAGSVSSDVLRELIQRGGVVMLDLIKRAMLLGIGTIDLAREKVEKMADELVKRGEMSEDERAKFVKDLMERAQKRAEEFKNKVDESVEKAIPRFMRKRDEQIAELGKKIDKLIERIERLERSA